MELFLKCINCGKTFEPRVIFRCPNCNSLLDVVQDIDALREENLKEKFDSRLGVRNSIYASGVWRFKELVHPLIAENMVVTRPEGNTNLYSHKKIAKYCSLNSIMLKHEGENPTGSFKDRGMTVGVSEAKRLGMRIIACASTGNTSASLASYASFSSLVSVVFVPEDNIAYGKLAQALAYGAKVLQIKGNFDAAMRLVQESCEELKLYLLNSINPWRIEGQKTIIFELIQQLDWKPPDWIVVPAGNLGNTSAFGKALMELQELELIDDIPKIAAIQASGANPFYKLWKYSEKRLKPVENPETIATAIQIGNPVSWEKALKAIKFSRGVVEEVSDNEIMDAKAIIDSSGIGCEPASAASVAGTKKLVEQGIIDKNEKVVCILTGNILKDPEATVNYHLSKLREKGIDSKFANKPKIINPDLEEVKLALSISS